ncbi:MAG: hypothetical protein HC936_08580, partial [Leptolyngbyaceae cyanobacterium SU_3_3]|nr:hypothetical protein [Leptolyngbyaceae cyanobacterium SU_3_3]
MEYLESSEQAEQLREIGTKLSQERQARSVSLEEIAAKTYIPMRLLSAIDAGRMDLLPEPIFVQGFIRRYADALGLDGSALSQGFSIEQQPAPPNRVDDAPSHPPEEVSSTLDLGQKPYWLYILGGMVGVGALGMIVSSLARPKVAEPPKPNSAQNSIAAISPPNSNSSSSSKPIPKASPKPISSEAASPNLRSTTA